MRILLILLAILSLSSKAEVYDYKVNRVIDGDTVEIQTPFLPPPLKPVLGIRILGVDTPEKGKRAKCEAEAEKGKLATAFTKEKIQSAKSIQVEIIDWDKYGGRILGDLFIDGERLSNLLIQNGHARPYDGGKKESWCNEVQ